MKLSVKRVAVAVSLLALASVWGCRTTIYSVVEAPAACITEEEWPESLLLAQGVLELCETTFTDPYLPAPLAEVCDRLAYLEARCEGVNQFRRSLQEAELR